MASDPDNYLSFVTGPEWWQDAPLVTPRTIGAPDGRLINMTFTAMCVRRQPRCYICGVPINRLVIRRKKVDPNWTIEQMLTTDGRFMTKDHLLAKHHQGRNNLDNYATCCNWCNQFKGCAAPNEPVFCSGWLKLAQEQGKIDDLRGTNGYSVISPKVIERFNRKELTPWTGFVKYQPPPAPVIPYEPFVPQPWITESGYL